MCTSAWSASAATCDSRDSSTPRFGTASARATAERATRFAGTDLGGLYANLADLQQVARNEEDHLAGLAGSVAPAPVVRVPFLDTDVHDLDGLAEIARHLFPS